MPKTAKQAHDSGWFRFLVIWEDDSDAVVWATSTAHAFSWALGFNPSPIRACTPTLSQSAHAGEHVAQGI